MPESLDEQPVSLAAIRPRKATVPQPGPPSPAPQGAWIATRAQTVNHRGAACDEPPPSTLTMP